MPISAIKSVRLPAAQETTLTELAGRLGYTAAAGPTHGEPSWRTMLSALADDPHEFCERMLSLYAPPPSPDRAAEFAMLVAGRAEALGFARAILWALDAIAAGVPEIERQIVRYIRETGMARIVTDEDDRRYVLFLDEGEYIPLDELSYDPNLGFHRRKREG